MNSLAKQKVLSLSELIAAVEDLKKQGRTVVQSHGVYDLIHPGIITHLRQAKEQGDVLVVTVIKDKDVRRGPGRPIFPDILRAEDVASLDMVDYVSVVDDETPFECVSMIKPDVFAKGQAYKERDRSMHNKIFEEERELYFGKGKIHETGGFSLSSANIVKDFLNIFPGETVAFLDRFSREYSLTDIVNGLNSLDDLKVLLLGDGIIDEYHYCAAMGKSAKSHLIVSQYITHEVFNGGAFAIANHVAGVCRNVHLVSLLGESESREEFVRNHLKPNVTTQFFYRDDGPTVVKKRYLDQYLNQKIFEVNYLNNEFISESCEERILAYLHDELPKYDLVLVSDFGHGLVTRRIKKMIEERSRKFAVNTQTNAANAGYNLITKYSKPCFACLDEPEIRLAAQERYADIEEIAKQIKTAINADYLMVTLGKKGSIGINRENEVNRTPIFSSRVIDTIGAGDAFFAFTAPCFAKDLPLDMVSFIGNAVGALAVQIVGNKKAVEKYELLAFIDSIIKRK